MRPVWKRFLMLAVTSTAVLLITSSTVEAQRGAFNKASPKTSPRGVASNPDKYTPPNKVESGGILGSSRLRTLHPIEMPRDRLNHVRTKHTPGPQAKPQQDGVFNQGENVEALIKKAEGRPALWQPKTANYQRVVRMERPIGTVPPKTPGQKPIPTKVYTVLTDANHKLVTAFPGLPRYMTKR